MAVLAWLLLAFGALSAYAGITGQSIVADLQRVLRGNKPAAVTK